MNENIEPKPEYLLASNEPLPDVGRDVINVRTELEVQEQLDRLADRKPEEGGARIIIKKEYPIGSPEWQAEIDRVRAIIELED